MTLTSEDIKALLVVAMGFIAIVAVIWIGLHYEYKRFKKEESK